MGLKGSRAIAAHKEGPLTRGDARRFTPARSVFPARPHTPGSRSETSNTYPVQHGTRLDTLSPALCSAGTPQKRRSATLAAQVTPRNFPSLTPAAKGDIPPILSVTLAPQGDFPQQKCRQTAASGGFRFFPLRKKRVAQVFGFPVLAAIPSSWP